VQHYTKTITNAEYKNEIEKETSEEDAQASKVG